MRGHPRLPEHLATALAGLGVDLPGATVVVALSGGRDSVALLHLLRFTPDLHPRQLVAAHFDHRMRAGSAGDAAWVRGLCRGWDVPLREGSAERPPRGETEARTARLGFLRGVQRELAPALLATGHHADDQAETVLFRAVRGTGPAGLAGIAPLDARGTLRPLLAVTRREIAAYARACGVRWRDDPTNLDPGAARNRIRLDVLPLLERTVAPGAARSLARLAGIAREERTALEALLAPLVDEAGRFEDGALQLVRARLRSYDPAVAALVLRALLRRAGVRADRTGTRLALQFITHGRSGGSIALAGGARVVLEFGLARVETGQSPAPDAGAEGSLIVEGGGGDAELRLSGCAWRVRWASGSAPAEGDPMRLAVRPELAPLRLRGRNPGDRVRTRAGTRTLKKILGEARVPVRRRASLPVLVDRSGTVLWVPGVTRAEHAAAAPGEPAIILSLADAEH